LDFFFCYRCAQVLSPLLLLLLDLLLLLLLDLLLLLLAADADARAVATPMDVGGATSSESSCELARSAACAKSSALFTPLPQNVTV
jgi:hypothetical protein